MESERAPAPAMWKPNPIRKWLRTHCLERTLWRLPRTDQVLDLCCGYGFYFSINPRARGVDGDPVCVRHLRERGFNVDCHDVLDGLPYTDGEFEYVVAHDVLEHFTYDQLEAIFSEVHRILKSAGCFLVFVPNRKGYDYGLRMRVGHQLFVTSKEIHNLRRGLFKLVRHYCEPLPRWPGRFFTHNKEVFELLKLSAPVQDAFGAPDATLDEYASS